MKSIFLTIAFFLSYHSYAQHSISLYGGWTASKIWQKLKPNFTPGPVYAGLYKFPIHHAVYAGLEYEYTLKPFRFSTGISVTEFGTGEYFFKDTPWFTSYVNIPLIIGRHWKLPKNFGFTLEAGTDFYWETSSSLMRNQEGFHGMIMGLIGLEAEWKMLKFGVRLNVGITEFMNRPFDILRHSGLTTYVGYTLWDSERAKARRAKRLEKKQEKEFLTE